MAYYWISGFFFRIVFPSLIIFVLYLRPTITTYIYLLMALYMPFFSVPSPVSMARETGVYVKMFVVVSLLTSLSVFGLFFILFFPRTTGYEIENCSFMETALRTYGVIQFRDLPSGNTAIQWLLPVIFQYFCYELLIMFDDWEMFGRRFRGREALPASLNDLRLALKEE
ncbi:piezo-type mechanosensitive ion channel component 2-like [Sitophilus oryzae]|uniref:Piezo-type mechanosensitive ion channel component 2-like n=1 Tax=Sitophilus oryzae TaxID=7048 RepID=A0A6J2X2S4_SITOR|nr:piezo-type mechanosensitive ion channel component 2-like [Sitophilus oryzae]